MNDEREPGNVVKAFKAFSQWLQQHRPGAPYWAALVALAAVGAVGYLQLSPDDAEVNATTLVLLLFGLLLLFALSAPGQAKDLLLRVSTFKLGSFELALGEIKRAERIRPLPSEDDGVQVSDRPRSGSPVRDHDRILDDLRSKLRFAWDIFELKSADIGKREYTKIVRWLRDQELLTEYEDAFLRDMFGGMQYDLVEWPAGVQHEFLDAAWQFSARFGPMVWDRHLRRQLRSAGWLVADFPQTRGHRPDFFAFHDGRPVLMAARVAGTPRNPADVTGTAKRLAESAAFLATPPRGLQVLGARIVIPDIRDAAPPEGSVRVLKLGELIDDPELAFQSAAPPPQPAPAEP